MQTTPVFVLVVSLPLTSCSVVHAPPPDPVAASPTVGRAAAAPRGDAAAARDVDFCAAAVAWIHAPAVPHLRQAARDGDPRGVWRAFQRWAAPTARLARALPPDAPRPARRGARRLNRLVRAVAGGPAREHLSVPRLQRPLRQLARYVARTC